MTDEKDLEIARLQGEIAGLNQARGGAITGTLKVIGTLIALAVGGLMLLVVLVEVQPKPTAAERQELIRQEAEKIVAKCETDYAGFPESTINDCKIRAAGRAAERF